MSSLPHLEALSIITLGLTGGGGTGSTDMIIQSGRAYTGLNPMTLQSSSLTFFKISCARSAVSSCSRGATQTLQKNILAGIQTCPLSQRSSVPLSISLEVGPEKPAVCQLAAHVGMLGVKQLCSLASAVARQEDAAHRTGRAALLAVRVSLGVPVPAA